MGKHRERMKEDLALRGLAQGTSEAYLYYARNFVAHFGRSPDQLGTDDVRSWLLWLLQDKKLAPATVNIAIAALRQLFTSLGRPEVMEQIRNVRVRHHAPDVLSGTEVSRLLEATTNIKFRAMFALRMAQACGSPNC